MPTALPFPRRVAVPLQAGLLGAVLLTGCRDRIVTPDPESVSWTPAERALLAELVLDRLPPPAPDPSNRVADRPAAAALGRALFFDVRLSANGAVSCGTCHVAAQQFQDGRPLAQGVGAATRRTMPVMATAHNTWQFWDGRRDSQWAQALAPLESAVEHGTTRLAVVRVVATHYPTAYAELFGPLPDLDGLPASAGPVADPVAAAAWAAIPVERQEAINQAFANIGKAIAAFERRIGYGMSRFDRAMRAILADQPMPVDARLTADERAGAALFVGKGQCITCHTGPLLTDQQFHNIGTPPAPGLAPDAGRWLGARAVRDDPFNCLGPYSDAPPSACGHLSTLPVDAPTTLGAVKTPSLRNVADRVPYMHAGQLTSLRDVVEHYDRAPAAAIGTSVLVPLRLTAFERAQLVAFLRTLSGGVTGGE